MRFANLPPKKIASHLDQWEADHHLPYEEAIKPMGALGFCGTMIPEQYGGDDIGCLAATTLFKLFILNSLPKGAMPVSKAVVICVAGLTGVFLWMAP